MTTALTLEQSPFFRGTKRFELRPNGELHVLTRSGSREEESIFFVRQISANTVRTRKRSANARMGFAIIAIIYAILCAAFLFGAADASISERLIKATLCSVLFTPMLLLCCAYGAWEGYDVTGFHSSWNGDQLFTISNRHPTRAEAEEFIAALKDAIQHAALSEGADEEKAIDEGVAEQIGQLDQLREAGTLTADEFTAAKRRLLGFEEEKLDSRE